jgi:hypothetical protein
MRINETNATDSCICEIDALFVCLFHLFKSEPQMHYNCKAWSSVENMFHFIAIELLWRGRGRVSPVSGTNKWRR